MDGYVYALASDGTYLYAAGSFTTAGKKLASNIARWDGTNWSALGSGVGEAVFALASDGSSLYAGGFFTTAGGAPASYIARWNGTSWSTLASGVNASVYALAWDGSSLYAGGAFWSAGGISAKRIARWDGTGWGPLGAGVNNDISALAWDGSSLYAGGWFTTAGGIPADRIARWDGTGWSPLGSGMDSNVEALAWDGSSLYAAGYFTNAGGIQASSMARWDGTGWNSLRSGMAYGVVALAWDGSSLYAGGDFTTAGGVPAKNIARWSGTSWSPLGSGVEGGAFNTSPVFELTWDGSSLYAGGSFTIAGGQPSVRIARWTCATIVIAPATLPTATVGVSNSVTFSASGGTSPYAFAITSGSAPPGLSLSPAGVLSGTPTTPGVYAFTITASGEDTCADSVDLVLLVNASGCPAISIAPVALPDAQLGASYSPTLGASGGRAPYNFTLEAGSLPPGIGLSPAGALSGTPTASGAFAFTVAATDAASCAGIQGYTLLVSTGTGNTALGRGLGPPNPNRVKVFTADGRPTGTDFLAYGASWGVSVAAGDLGAGAQRVDQILTGPGPGPLLGPHVRGFLRDGTPMAKVSFYAYGTLRYGVNPAAGLLDGDAFDEILTGAGAGAVFGPQVRGWNYDGIRLTSISKISYFAYGTLRYGVNVHRGDVDGDAFHELLTGPGPGAMFGPQVRGWNYDGASLQSMARMNFDAFGTSGYGVNVAGGGVDIDAFDELACAAGPGPTFTPAVRGFDYDASSVTALPGFALTISTTAQYGARVGLGDVTGDTVQELLAGKGRDRGADARVSLYGYATGTLVA